MEVQGIEGILKGVQDPKWWNQPKYRDTTIAHFQCQGLGKIRAIITNACSRTRLRRAA